MKLTNIALVLANAVFLPFTIITIVFGVLGGGATVYNAMMGIINILLILDMLLLKFQLLLYLK